MSFHHLVSSPDLSGSGIPPPSSMRRTTLPTHCDAQRRGEHGTGSTSRKNSNNSAAATSGATAAAAATATLAAWTRARLVESTSHILAAQPADPLRVHSVRLSMETLLLAAYPARSAPSGGEKDAEAPSDPGRVMGASTATPPAMKTVVSIGVSPKLKSSSAAGYPNFSAPAVEHLVEQVWVRQLLQPYGLHAVARCVCACPPLRLAPPARPTSTAWTAMHGSSSDSLAVAAETMHTPSPALQQSWMDMFALLHRQSRLSGAELVAVSAVHRDASAGSAASVPPADYRATEEIPVSLALLAVMAVIEEHLRAAECGGGERGTGRPPRLCRRLQMAVKALAMQLLVSLLQMQLQAESTVCSSSSSSTPPTPVTDEALEKEGGATVGTPYAMRDVYRLSAEQMDELHGWMQDRLHDALSPSPSPSSPSSPAVSGHHGGDAVVDIAGVSPAAALQSRISAYLDCLVGGGVSGAAPAAVTLDTFVAFMERLSPLLVAHQHTVTAMAMALAARTPTPSSTAGEPWPPPWTVERVGRCAAALAQRLSVADDSETATSTAPPLPLAWRMHVNQLAELLAPFRGDAVEHARHQSTDGDVLHRLRQRLVSWTASTAAGDLSETPRHGSNNNCSSGAMLAELVGAWVSHVAEACIVTLYS
ncbi:hypothetical protein NESM_000124500 [Novymonas esmeraldas]|uniref:Uncharacterized protein n=1 Tax=Novymonas esmeraldas TaxID=1808958 RepID=A0AAW0F4U5_9TRYP